jgi:hypothetical protein
VLLRLPSSDLHRLDSPRLHLSVEHSTQPPVTLVARHLATTSLSSLHLRHSALTFTPVWTNALPHVATSPMHPHLSTTPCSIPPSHFPTHSTAPTYTPTQSSDNPLRLSTRSHWSRRLATTCLSLHYRSFTNCDTPTLRLPRPFKVASPSQHFFSHQLFPQHLLGHHEVRTLCT